MKFLKISLFAFGVSLCGVCGILIFSNPTPQEYEEFAVEEISNYLDTKGCSKLTTQQPSLQNPCQGMLKLFLDVSKIQLKQLISSQTQQQNFLLFSLYRTNLELPAPLPSYQVETIAILKRFYIYSADQTN